MLFRSEIVVSQSGTYAVYNNAGKTKRQGFELSVDSQLPNNFGLYGAYTYLDAKFDPAFQLKAAQLTPYVGLERLQSGADIKFIERSYVSNILPNRDVGLSVHGNVFGDKLDY